MGIGAGKIAPGLVGGATWPYVVVGVAYAIAGIALIAYGNRRLREVDEALERGEYVAPSDRIVTAFTAVGVVLGMLTISLVVYQS